jgi:imidazole glycerol-phosphate synthase subunit HisH
MISIINYGLGNIKAIQNVYSKLSIPTRVVSDTNELCNSEKLILPGVGAFDYAMQKLKSSGMYDCINELVMEKRIQVLGICVGMQMLTKSSEEGVLPGLGWIDAVVKKFDVAKFNVKIQLPHMGWNDVESITENPLFDGLNKGARFYFLHSYHVVCNNEEDAIAKSNYTGDFVCAVNYKNIYGVQFHPEKSHQYGVKLLENFARI